MISKLFKVVLLVVLAFGLSTFSPTASDAATTKVMWGKTELKLGQIGKVTVKSKTVLYKLEKNNKLTKIRDLKAGEEFRVYSYKSMEGGLYGVGASSFIYKSPVVKYETPSKSKLALLSGKTPVVTLPTPTTPVTTKPVVTKDKNTIYKEKIDKVVNTSYKNYREYAEALYKIQTELNNEKDNFNGKYDMLMNFGDLYYKGGLEVDEMVFTFDNDVSLLAFKREPSSYNNNFPTNRSAILYNNEYYFDIGFIETILSADLNMYYFDKLHDSTKYDGKFNQNGPSYQRGSEFKDESNKKLGAYNFVYLKNTVKDKTLTISQKEFPYNNLGMVSTGLSPYSNDEIKQILDIEFDVAYDSKNAVLTIHFNKPSKEKSGMGDW